MRRSFIITGILASFFLGVALITQGSGIVPAIVPALVPTANKTSTTSTVFALASSNALTASSPVCTNANGDMTTTGCTANAVTSTSPVTVNANSTADQQMMELSLTAGYLNSLGRPFDFFGAGVYTTQAGQTPTLEMKIKLCTVSGCGSGTVVSLIDITTTATTANSPNVSWNLRALGTTNATGATGNLEIHGNLTADLGNLISTSDTIFTDTNTAVSSNIDLTAALFVDFTVKFSTNAATANTMTQREGAVNPGGSTSGGGGGSVTFAAPYVTSGANTFGPNWALTIPPLAGWTFDNQGGATNDTAKGYDYGHFPVTSAAAFRGLYRSAPATPYSITVLMSSAPLLSGAGTLTGAIFGFRDAAGKWELIFIGKDSTGDYGLFVMRWTNSTTFSANQFTANSTPDTIAAFNSPGPVFFKVVDDGTNITFNWSIDGGGHFQQLYTELRGAFFTGGPGPNAIGWGALCDSTSVDTALLSWLQGTS